MVEWTKLPPKREDPTPEDRPETRSFTLMTVVDGVRVFKSRTRVGVWLKGGKVWMSATPKGDQTLDDIVPFVARRAQE